MIEEKVSDKVRLITKKKGHKMGLTTPQASGISSSGRQKASSFGIQSIRERMNEIQKKRHANDELGLISTRQLYGNDLSGDQWFNQQKRRHQFQQTQANPDKEAIDVHEEDQVIYIEPSDSQKRLEELRKQGKPFTDQVFPPNDSSMSGVYGYIPQWDTVKWEKISATMKKSKLFDGKPSPCDIRQGALGDCYFLAGVAAIAERPDRILQIFLLDNKNDMNYYSVKIIYRGKWRKIDLDEFIPWAYNEPAFSRTIDNQLWVIILEKAWAKLYGSYKQLQGGFPEQPLHDLTGAPIKHLFLKDTSDGQNEWEYLFQASKKQYPMVASSNPGSDTNKSEVGIFQGHAYTFLNATKIKYNNKQQRVVQLRNPWGQGQFQGRWSDLDPIWNSVSESQKKRVSYAKNTEDGVFFMNFQDFMYEFRLVTVAQVNDNASYIYESFIDTQVKGAYFAIQIKNGGQYSLQIDKTPERSFTGAMQQNYRFPEAQLEIGRLQSGKITKFRGYISKRRTLFKKYDLTPGTYIAWVKIDFDSEYQKDYEVVLAVYSEFAAKIRLATTKQSITFNNGKQTKWTGKRAEKTNLPRQNSKNLNTPKNLQPKEKGVFSKGVNLMNKDKGSISTLFGTDSNLKQHSTDKKSQNISKTSLDSSGKKKKLRRIQVEKTKVQTIQQDINGQSIVKTNQNQIKKESVERSVEGGKSIKSKQMQNSVESIEVRFEGQTKQKKQKIKQTLTISEEKPDGRVMKKVSTKQREIQTVEEDDDATDSFLQSQLEDQDIKNLENSKISSQSRRSSPELARGVMSYSQDNHKKKVMNQLNNDQEFSKRNIIRYPEEHID